MDNFNGTFLQAADERTRQLRDALAGVITEDAKGEGTFVLTVADITTPEAKDWQDRAAAARDCGDHKTAKGYMDMLNNKYGKKPVVVHNLLPTVGRTAIIRRLMADPAYTNIINKVALGTGSTAPANADTQLQTEVYRNNPASLTYANNIGYLSGFFNAAETSGTYAEVGLFIDGTAAANTGVLFSHALASITKSAIQTLTVDWIITLS